MKIHENFLSDQILSELRQEFDQWYAKNTFTEQYTIDHEDTIKEIFNLTEKSLIQQKRSELSKTEIGEYIKKLLGPLAKLSPRDFVYFSRSFYPIGLHADTDDKQSKGKTFLIPLTYDERVKTIVFKDKMTNPEFGKFVQEFANNISKFEYKSNLSEQYKLAHCWFGSPNLLDYMELDGMGAWAKGSVIEFDRNQLHASNNYKDFVDYKDYILVHTNE